MEEDKPKRKYRKKTYTPLGIFIEMPDGKIVELKDYTPKMHREYLKSIGEEE